TQHTVLVIKILFLPAILTHNGRVHTRINPLNTHARQPPPLPPEPSPHLPGPLIPRDSVAHGASVPRTRAFSTPTYHAVVHQVEKQTAVIQLAQARQVNRHASEVRERNTVQIRRMVDDQLVRRGPQIKRNG